MTAKSKSAATALTVDISTAAQMLALSERTIARLAKNGVLPSVRFGRRRVYPIKAIEAAIAAQLEAQGAAG